MIDTELLRSTIDRAIAGSDIFVVGIDISPEQDIVVSLDSATGLDTDTCARISRDIEQALDRDDPAVGDYSLEVGSAGLTAPLRVMGQWLKNRGQRLEMLTADGRKLRARLIDVDPQAQTATVEYMVKERPEGAKRPVEVAHRETLDIPSIRQAVCLIEF